MLTLLLAVATILALVLASIVGADRSVIVAFFAATCVMPLVVLRTVEGPHVGIAGAGLEITTYSVTIAGGFFLTRARRQMGMNIKYFIPFVVFLVVSFTALWARTPEQQAGTVQLLLGMMCFALGSTIGTRKASVQGVNLFFVTTLLAIIIIQLTLSSLQTIGLISAYTDAQTADLVSGRASGTFNHPNNLAKAIFLITCMALPSTRNLDPKIRRRATAVVVLALVPLTLTGGRAATLAVLLMLGLWAIFDPSSRGLARRLAVLGTSVTAGFVFYSLFRDRIVVDSSGARDRFMQVALEVLPTHLIAGVGPNSYVTAASPYDSLTAAGWPVHNTFVLAAVEIGVLGAALYFLPLARVVVWSMRGFRRRDDVGARSRTLICSIPGLLLISFTGWGLLGSSILPLWFFTFGFLREGPERPNRTDAASAGALAIPLAARRLTAGVS